KQRRNTWRGQGPKAPRVTGGISLYLRWRANGPITAMNAAAHDHDALEFAESGRIFVDGGVDVIQRADGNQRDLAWMQFDLPEKKINTVRIFTVRLTTSIGCLRKDIGLRGTDANCNGNIRAVNGSEVPVKKASAKLGIAISGGDSEKLYFRAF